MANQDSGFIAISGSLASNVTTYLYHNASISASGTLSLSIEDIVQVSETFTSMSCTLSMNVSPVVETYSGKISMNCSLSASVTPQNLVNAYITMYGFLSANVNTYSALFCTDMNVAFEEQIIESTGCTIGEESMALTRYRGDTYPVSTKLSKNGSTDVTGITFKMSTQIAKGTLYTVNGTIENAEQGVVKFPLEALAVSIAGVGEYDIEGNDGTYIYTYEKGVFTLLDDLTP